MYVYISSIYEQIHFLSLYKINIFVCVYIHIYIFLKLERDIYYWFCFSGSPLYIFWLPGEVLGKQNLKGEFCKQVWGFWNWLCNLIILKDANDCISGSREHTDSLWHELFIHKIFALDAPNQPHKQGAK